LNAQNYCPSNFNRFHEMRFAAEVADNVIFMADGVIVEEGPPRRLLHNPTQERTQRFLAEVFK